MKKIITTIFAATILLTIPFASVSAAEISEKSTEGSYTNIILEGSDELSGEGICYYTGMQSSYYMGCQLGDADMDGKITINDATLMQKYIADIAQLSSLAERNADIDLDKEITIDDVTILQENIAGII